VDRDETTAAVVSCVVSGGGGERSSSHLSSLEQTIGIFFGISSCAAHWARSGRRESGRWMLLLRHSPYGLSALANPPRRKLQT